MINKKILISLICIMFLVGIGCVSAEDIDEIGTLSSSDVVGDAISLDDDVGGAAVENDVSTDSADDDVISDVEPTRSTDTWGNFKAEVENTGISTVKLNQSNIAPSTSSSDQITLNHDVTIVGGYGYYIGHADWSSSPKYNYIPFITSGNNLNVKFENVTFQYLSDNILMKLMGNGNYIFKNCVFDHINATGDHQSVLWLYYGYALIDNCTFTNCNCSFGAVTNYYTSWGTAVNNARMTVKDSTFRNNYATIEPGAINNCGKLIVYDSTFENNRAAQWAGAIHTHSNANTTIVRSNFRNNIAGWNGGALYTYSHLTVIDSNFTGNEAYLTSGGAIAASSYMSKPYLTVVNCEFNDNYAVGSGGAISFGSSTLTVENSRFNNNIASSENGGAISTGTATSTISNCEFKYNEASGMGGAVYGSDKGRLTVDHCIFVYNTANINYGLAIAYYYTGNSNTAAYLTYTNNNFTGPNNGAGSVYVYNNKVVVTQSNNTNEDISNYTEPENDTNGSGSVVSIPGNAPIGNQLWNTSLSGALGGTPLVIGDRIYVPNGHSIYCLNITNGNLLWNVSSNYIGYLEWDNFHDLGLHNGVLIAPCDGDKLYFFNATNGNQIQSTSNIIQGSSLYAPLVVGNSIYISSEYGYGVNNEYWIAVINYNNGVYSYAGSILNISGVSYGTHALISAPILWNNYLWVNTINGLMRVNLTTGASSVVLTNAVGKIVDGGNYLYVLTGNNHICSVDASGNVVKHIIVPGDVGSTLAINNDNTILYTVNANGNIYAAETTDSVATFIYKVNPVSSALTVGADGYLYVGDDAGILWAFNIVQSMFGFEISIAWAYNLTSMAQGMILFNNNIIYTGTNETFYAFYTSPNNINSLNNIIQSNNYQTREFNELLGSSVDNILTEIINVTDETLSSSTFSNSDTIYELVNENYYFNTVLSSGLLIGSDGRNAINNIIIRAKNGNKVRITLTNDNPQGIWIVMGNNITIENIIFTGASIINQDIFCVSMNANVTIKNCTFENFANTAANRNLILVGQVNPNRPSAVGATFENCQFTNCSALNYFFKISKINSVNIKNCTFDNVSSINAYPFYFEDVNVDWENNNIINSNSKTIFDIGGSDNNLFNVNLNILTESLIVGEEGSIVAELVDDNGNRIKSDKLKLSIDGISETPTFDPNTGLYTSSKFTPTGNEVSVGAECSNIDPFNFETVYIPVKSTTDLVINCSDSGVYGTEFKVNSTLNSTITGENITFTVFNSTNDLVKSVNTTITNGFASYSFADLPAGDYTVVADYVGGTSFAPVSDSKAFTITQADSSIEINVLNDIIHVGDAINVKAVVPTGATGNVTFRLENSKTVNVSEVATFDGLSAGNYTIFAIYNGDANYKASNEANVEIEVVKYNLNLTITADNINYGEVLVVKVHTNANYTGGIFVYIGESKQGAPIFNGEGNATFANLTAAEYFITANFTGDDFFYADSANTTATVKGVEVPADKALNINVPANSKSPTFSIKLDKDATGNFTVSVDNGKIVKTVSLKDGSASITVDNLAVGSHQVTVSYSGDGKYAPITQNTTVTIKEPAKPASKVTKKATKIVAKKKTFKAKVKVKKYTITLKSGKTLLKKVKVTLKVKGKTYKATTNKKGKATFKIKNLKKKGTYKAVIKFKGNKNYKATSKKVKIKVKK